MLFIALFISVFVSFTASTEYRVYQYEIIPPEGGRPDGEYIVTDTLDPAAFSVYHGGETASEIRLLRTWMCRGFTGGRQVLCPSPAKNLPAAANP